MFFARGETRVGPAAIASHLALDRDVMLFAVRREHVCFDTRFVPPSREDPQDVSLAWLVRRGEVRWGAGVHERATGPVALAMPEHLYEGAHGARALTVHACGAAFEAVDVRFRAAWSRRGRAGLEVVPLDDATWDAVGRYVETVMAQPERDGAARAACEELLAALVAAGLVERVVLGSLAAEHHDPSVDALWASIRAAFGPLDAGASLKTLAAAMGVSLRTTARVVAMARRGLLTPPGGWRDTLRSLRSRLAVQLLSRPELSIGEIASAVGYQRAEAMTNAFQHDGLPAPREVRRLLLAVHAGA